MQPSRFLAVVLLSGCVGDDRGGNGAAPLDVAIAESDSLTLADEWVTLIAYLPGGEGPMDTHGVSWTWNLEYVPAGSNTTISDPTSGLIDLYLDAPGTYLVRVTGERDGVSGEATAMLEAFAFGPGLQVKLTWDVDTTDVDLHLVNLTEGGAFYAAPFDCHYANMSPDWPPQGPPGDPDLDVDDTNGFGPERIEVVEPLPTSYRVYVHYFSDDGIGPTNATVDVGFDDVPLFGESQLLSGTDIIWEVADFDTGTGAVTPIGLVYLDTSFGFAPSSKSDPD